MASTLQVVSDQVGPWSLEFDLWRFPRSTIDTSSAGKGVLCSFIKAIWLETYSNTKKWCVAEYRCLQPYYCYRDTSVNELVPQVYAKHPYSPSGFVTVIQETISFSISLVMSIPADP